LFLTELLGYESYKNMILYYYGMMRRLLLVYFTHDELVYINRIGLYKPDSSS